MPEFSTSKISMATVRGSDGCDHQIIQRELADLMAGFSEGEAPGGRAEGFGE